MLWLEDIESEDNIVVAKWHIAEWAKTVCVQMDNLDKRLETVEGVMEHGHHEAPVITVVGSLMPEQEAADWTEEDTCECLECGETYKIVHPRKGTDTCRCGEVRQLTEEVAELRRRSAEKSVGLLAEIERMRTERDGLRVDNERLLEQKDRMFAARAVLRAEHAALRAVLNECRDYLANHAAQDTAWRKRLLITVKDMLYTREIHDHNLG